MSAPVHTDHVCLRHIDRASPFGSLHAADVRMPPGRHDEPAVDAVRLCLVVDGLFEQSTTSHRRTLSRSTVRVSPPDSSTRYRFGAAGGRCFFLEYEIREPSDRRYLLPSESVFMPDHRSMDLAWQIYSAFNDGEEAPLMLESTALELLVRAARMPDLPSGPPPDWLGNVRNWIHDCHGEPLTLADAAVISGVTPVHLSRAFRRHYGCTMGDYLRAVRVEYAKRSLAGRAAPLVRVALDSGFYDQSHMCRTFRQVLGMTPGAYRQSTSGQSPESE